jgi:hypothetical protein
MAVEGERVTRLPGEHAVTAGPPARSLHLLVLAPFQMKYAETRSSP